MSSLENYLSRYSISPKKSKRKKKRKHGEVSDTIREEVLDGDYDDTPVIVDDKKGVKGIWKSVETNEQVDIQPKLMEDGSYAGLQTKEQLEASRRSKVRKLEEARKAEESRYDADKTETVYRDLSGQRLGVDDAKLRSRVVDKEEEKAQRKIEMDKVNRSEADVIRKLKELAKLKDIKGKSMNVYEDDKQVNMAGKSKVKEEDPALMFDKNVRKSYEEKKGEEYVSLTGRKLYKQGYPENRFGIKPGWRWDGVDRGNGFERRWFERQAEITERKVMEYTTAEDAS
ncbi:DEKNAAC102679 [Brettanomyces naardenensis]|uniref:Pre-mRNA-splicing factor CWC26 n=1 Tax=Brettanomyces naardenensis TaxID=13370 RepID=A0A448YLL0_BRENA|nr:DEKNAAC102679 [Brettanomyces naardenensis]